jgi:hypothetical protein
MKSTLVSQSFRYMKNFCLKPLLGTSTLISLISLVVSPSAAHALSFVRFNDVASFNAATQNLDTINFNGIAPTGSFVQENVTNSITRVGTNNGAVTFGEVNNTGNLFVVSTSFATPSFAFNSSATGTDAGASLVELGNGVGISASGFTSSNIYAVGADILSSGAATAQNFTVTIDTLGQGSPSTFTISTQAQPTSQFIGFTSDTQILDIKFVSNAGNTQLTNFTFGQVNVPVPLEINSTLGISILGCLWGAKVLRKKLAVN